MGIKEKYARYEAIAKEIEAGLTAYEASAKHGLSLQTIYRIVHEWGVATPANGLWPQIKSRNDEIVTHFQAGETLEAIGAAYGITRERVRQITNKANQVPRSMQKQQRDEDILALLIGADLTVKEASEFTGLPIYSLHSLNKRFGYPIEFKKDRLIDDPAIAEMAAKVADGMSIYEASGKDHRVAALVQDYCKEAGIVSVHGRWHDRAKRKEIVLRMRKAGKEWPDVVVAVSEAEDKQIELESLVNWSKRHAPEVFKVRHRIKAVRPHPYVPKQSFNPDNIKPVMTVADVKMAPTLREAVKVNRGKVPATLIAQAYGVSRNSVIGLWYRMRKSGEISE